MWRNRGLTCAGIRIQAIYDLRTEEISSAKTIKAEVEPLDVADFVQA